MATLILYHSSIVEITNIRMIPLPATISIGLLGSTSMEAAILFACSKIVLNSESIFCLSDWYNDVIVV